MAAPLFFTNLLAYSETTIMAERDKPDFSDHMPDSGPPGCSTPCIDICTLDIDGYCIGCFRHQDEIAAWSRLSESQRRQIMSELDDRKATWFAT